MRIFTDTLPIDLVFLGDGPGQAETTMIGRREYRRGEVYGDVPPTHYAKGGFHAMDEIDDVLVYHKVPPKCAIVLGTAPCMWDDLERAPKGWDVVAVNGAGFLYLEPIKMWCSVHGKYMHEWIEKRRVTGASMDFEAFGNFGKRDDPGDIHAWNMPNGNGSSGLFGVLIALEHGYTKIVLCGIPLEGQERHDYKGDSVEVVEAPTDYKHYRSGWLMRRDYLKLHVRSMSGWTKELFGEPTAEWLNS